MQERLAETLLTQAEALGFTLFGVAPAVRAPHAEAFKDWLAAGCQADMTWLERAPERRTDPRQVMPGARSLVVVGMEYFQGDTPRQEVGRIARYAWGGDYHDLIEKRLRQLAAIMEADGGTQRVYVDTGPVLERDFATLAGIAWQGKSTMAIHRQRGAWFFLGTILTTLELPVSKPERDHCGRCLRCVEACPTEAILEGRRVDARRCIAWLTIENKGAIPEPLRRAIGDRVYGCDECIEVCPWNRFARESREATFQMPEGLAKLQLRDCLEWDEPTFRTFFKGSPIKRLKLPRWQRNVCVVLGNTGSRDDFPALTQATAHPHPLVAEHAVWAVAELRRRLVL